MAFQAFKNAIKMATMGFKLSRAAKRSAPKIATTTTGSSVMRSPAAAASIPAEFANLTPDQLQLRIKELRKSLEENQKQTMEEQSKRFERAVNSPDTSDPNVAAAARELAEEERALANLKKRLEELDVDREAYRAEISAATLKSVQSADAYGLSNDAAPIFSANASTSTDAESTSEVEVDAASPSSKQSSVDQSLRESVEQVARGVTAETDQAEKNTAVKSSHHSSSA